MNNVQNLGEVLGGDRIEKSAYAFKTREEQMCKVGCQIKLDAAVAKNFQEKIGDEYRVTLKENATFAANVFVANTQNFLRKEFLQQKYCIAWVQQKQHSE